MAESLTVTPSAAAARELEAAIVDGRYLSQNEIVAEVLADWLIKQRERKAAFDSLKTDIDVGLRDMEAGRTVPFDAEAIIARGERRLADHSTSG